MNLGTGYTNFLPLLLVMTSLSSRDVMALDYKVYRRVESYLSRNCEAVSSLLPQVCQYSFWQPVGTSPACCSVFSLVDACSGSTCSSKYDRQSQKSLETLVFDPSFCNKLSEVGKYYCRSDSKSASCLALRCMMNMVCFNGLTQCDTPPNATPQTDSPRVDWRNPNPSPRVDWRNPNPSPRIDPGLAQPSAHPIATHPQTHAQTHPQTHPQTHSPTADPDHPPTEPETMPNSQQRQSRNFDLPETAACESTNLVDFDARNLGTCPVPVHTSNCNGHMRYRTFDGKCNNLRMPEWGMAFTTPKRLVDNHYEDGQFLPRTMSKRTGNPLMSVRYISREVCTDQPNLAGKLDVMHMAFGQYIDHDMTGFPVIKFKDEPIKCCVDNLREDWKFENGGPCFPIEIPHNDTFFQKSCMEFIRSSPKLDDNQLEIFPREQINSLSAVIDASTVYGSTSNFTRDFKMRDGTLKVTRTTKGDMLPRSGLKNCKTDPDDTTTFCQAAGDGRVNVFVGLGMMHTVFHREHNRLVRGLKRATGNRWTSEKYFEEARKINAAIHQVITYKEYLPSFLNAATMKKYGLTVPTVDASGRNIYDYNNKVNPQMSNEFSTAAFRYGHSQIQRTVKVGNHSRVMMQDTLMRPQLLQTFGVEDIITGMVTAFAESVDRLFVTAVTDRLFETNRDKKDGLDLVALNTQRGRDHGLAPYNKYREFCGLGKVRNFDSLSNELKGLEKFKLVYEHVDDIDLFIGGIAETKEADSQVGPTFACILGQQFHDIKYGDRFWYETKSQPEGFTEQQLAEIQKVTLSSVLCQNSDLRELQVNSLFFASETNPILDCNRHPKIDLNLWANV